MYDNMWFPLKYKDKCYRISKYIKTETTYKYRYDNKHIMELKVGSIINPCRNLCPKCSFTFDGVKVIKIVNNKLIVKCLFCNTYYYINDILIIYGKSKKHKIYYDLLNSFRFRYDPVPHIHTHTKHNSYFRHPKTFQEKKMSLAYNKLFIRSKRNINNLPSEYNGIYKHKYKSWKHCTTKRKQWM